jgi:glycosyltransferase involved in cell wall biosynthesis
MGSKQWWGGITYLHNLLHAISRLGNRKIAPLIITGKKTDSGILSMYKPYAEIIQDSVLDLWSAKWFADRMMNKLSGKEFLFGRMLKDNSISVVSHLLYGMKGTDTYRTISWIPDFQHLHLPEMFSKAEMERRNRQYADLAKKSDLVIVSSHDALSDFKRFAPEFASKARVLNFVSQSSGSIDMTDRGQTETKYGIAGKYFFLPNQFWKHKNHRIVFEAIKLLRDKNQDVLLICSGTMDDNRNKDHVGELVEYIRINKLERNIKLLGMIPPPDLFCLMRNCVSCLNPSLFEGWSTTVEEAKSLGKNMILSDIPVHREQSPAGSVFFEPHNAEQLAAILFKKFNKHPGGPDFELERTAKERLRGRTIQFGENYQKIILEIAS